LKGSNELNKALEEKLVDSGKILLSHAMLDDKYVLRFSVGSWTTKEENVKNAWLTIQEEAAKLLPH
jgi:hypothetical protein